MPVEVINTGVSGIRTMHHLATLKEIERYHPTLVLIMLGGNDWNRDIKVNNYQFFKKGLFYTKSFLIGSEIEFEESPLGKFLKKLKSLFEKRKYKHIIDDGGYYTSQRNSLARPQVREYLPPNVSSEYQHYLKKILERCLRGTYRCLIVSQPSAYQRAASEEMRGLFWMTPPNEGYTLSFESLVYIANLYNKYLEAEAKRMNVPFCDAASRIPPTTEFFYDDMHLNSNGAKRLAEIIFECIKANKLLH
jgi:hypothetical protein